MYTHQDCPFEKFVEAINPERRTNQNPFCNVAFFLQNYPQIPVISDTIDVRFVSLDTQAVVLDLFFLVRVSPQGLSLECHYSEELFDAETITHLSASYCEELQQLVQHPEAPIAHHALSEVLATRAEAARQRNRTYTIAVSATFAADPLEQVLHFWMQELDIPHQVQFAVGHQILPQRLDPTGLLAQNTYGLNVILVRFEDWLRDSKTATTSAAGCTEDALTQSVHDFVQAVQTAAARTAIPHLVCVCPATPNVAADVSHATFFGLDRGIGHFMLFEVDSKARAPAPLIPKSPQTSSAASDRKSARLPSSRQVE